MRLIKPIRKRILLGLWLLIIAALLTWGLFVLTYSLERKTYKLDYPEEIERYAAKYNLDKYLVAAMIHCESGNDPEAESPKGAIGLMQIMPDTAEWAADKLGIENFTLDMLKEPHVNIEIGCWYLSFLNERFSSDLHTVIAAYNAGHGRVAKWLNDPNVSLNGELVNIPYQETEDYLKKVQRAYDKYKILYKDKWI